MQPEAPAQASAESLRRVLAIPAAVLEPDPAPLPLRTWRLALRKPAAGTPAGAGVSLQQPRPSWPQL